MSDSTAPEVRVVPPSAAAVIEDFLERCAAEFHRDGGPDTARVMEIAAEHGIHFAWAA